MSLWVCRSHGLTGPTGCCPNAECVNVVPSEGTGWTLTYTGADGKPVTVTADLGPARPIEYTPAPMPSPTPAEEERIARLRVEGRFAWAGTGKYVDTPGGPRLSKSRPSDEDFAECLDLYRRAIVSRCLAAVMTLGGIGVAQGDGLTLEGERYIKESDALAALTALLSETP